MLDNLPSWEWNQNYSTTAAALLSVIYLIALKSFNCQKKWSNNKSSFQKYIDMPKPLDKNIQIY